MKDQALHSLYLKKGLGTQSHDARNVTAVYAGDTREEQTVNDICNGRY